MIDFGLAGLFERFEKEFGRTVTRALLGLIGVTIVVVSLGLIAQFIWAFYQWTTNTLEGTSMVWLAAKLIGFLIGFGAIIGTPMFFSWMYESKTLLREAESSLQASTEISQKTKQLHEEAKLLHQELTHLRAEIRQALQEAGSGNASPTGEAPGSQSPPSTEEKKRP